MSLNEIIVSDASNIVPAVLALAIAYLHFVKAQNEEFRRVSKYVRAFNWMIFGFIFIYITLAGFMGSDQRAVLRVSFWILLAAEIFYNYYYFNNGKHH